MLTLLMILTPYRDSIKPVFLIYQYMLFYCRDGSSRKFIELSLCVVSFVYYTLGARYVHEFINSRLKSKMHCCSLFDMIAKFYFRYSANNGIFKFNFETPRRKLCMRHKTNQPDSLISKTFCIFECVCFPIAIETYVFYDNHMD